LHYSHSELLAIGIELVRDVHLLVRGDMSEAEALARIEARLALGLTALRRMRSEQSARQAELDNA